MSRWEEDVFSQGAYSFHTEENIDVNHDLYNPIEGRIFFAGEYTDPVYFGSLHAAYNSGLRVLEEIRKTYSYHYFRFSSKGKVQGKP